MASVDLNSDLGESYSAWKMGDDAAMLELVSSANIACGFHAGDPAVMLKTVRNAAARKIAIGAHVSYPDRAGFGRRDMDVTAEELIGDIIYQVGALQGMARAAGTEVRYVKPHGALYNHIAQHERQALAVIRAIKLVDPTLMLMGLAGTPVLALARAEGLAVIPEIFADRGYTPQGLLVSRREPGAVLHDADQVAERMLKFIRTGMLAANDGTELRIAAGSICVHGDSPDAVNMARAIRHLFVAEGITVQPFA
ncbi:MAG: LamB/YcsF family protein [Rhodospirillales bacterium]|nr:LamB/YcsF family protein [Rhodospirillales bacterium]MDE2318524.1 LamB/YcsF family protein [Rhodospirillales bacterium]